MYSNINSGTATRARLTSSPHSNSPLPMRSLSTSNILQHTNSSPHNPITSNSRWRTNPLMHSSQWRTSNNRRILINNTSSPPPMHSPSTNRNPRRISNTNHNMRSPITSSNPQSSPTTPRAWAGNWHAE